MYLDFIKQQLQPKLQKLLHKYSVWWSFKPESQLKDYLEDNDVYLNTFFRPSELYEAITSIVESTQSMKDSGNNDIVILDAKLQDCFKSWVIYKPELMTLCQEHIDILSPEMSAKLQNESIVNELCIHIPENIIFNDPASMFWLHPEINALMSNNVIILYSWKQMYDVFFDFCTTNKTHFYPINDSIYQIDSNSMFARLFNFKYFHKDQIEDLLKGVTLFLGKSNTLKSNCPFFKVQSNIRIFSEIDYFINICTKYLPNIYTPMSL